MANEKEKEKKMTIAYREAETQKENGKQARKFAKKEPNCVITDFM